MEDQPRMERIPLFPLKTVLFPGAPLRLRVFEPRYLDLVRDCLREQRPFGVCLIERGLEVGRAALPYAVGTLAQVVDWEQRRDGLLGITIEGVQRFRIQDVEVQPNELQIGIAERLEEPEPTPLPARYRALAQRLERILQHLDGLYSRLTPHYDDAYWVSCRLAEVLPLSLFEKQQLLELDDPLERLAALEQHGAPKAAASS